MNKPMQHLSSTDYTTMPWANGKGVTVEMMRVNAADGSLLWRLSRASVVEDGAFSLFAGVERNLTVITGPGFDLVGDLTLRCDPLCPVAFPGDVVLAASGVTAPCDDFNVMTARRLPKPTVQVVDQGVLLPPKGGFLAIFCLTDSHLAGLKIAAHDLLITSDRQTLSAGKVIAVGLIV